MWKKIAIGEPWIDSEEGERHRNTFHPNVSSDEHTRIHDELRTKYQEAKAAGLDVAPPPGEYDDHDPIGVK